MLTRSWIFGLLALGLLAFARPSLATAATAGDEVVRYQVPLEGAPYRGVPHAKVTIVEFADFQCGFCGRVNETLAELLRRYPTQLKIVYRHMPLPFHKQAMLAAEASVSASAQGKFWVMFDRLFANPRALDRASLEQHARALGLDVPRFLADLKTGRFRSYVLKDLAMAQRLGVNGTPMFFINGRALSGAQPLVEFTTVIDEELAHADKLLAKGVPLAKVYGETTKNGLREASPEDEGDEEAGDEPQRPRRDPDAIVPVPVGSSPILGRADAKVTIVEFSDFQCPFCARVQPVLEEVRKTYGDDVRIVYKHLPLSFHQHAEGAAQAGAAAAAQGKFWPMAEELFAHQSALSRAELAQRARAAGLDVARFALALASGRFAADVRADLELARQFQVDGTPTFFINGKVLTGAQPFDTFKRLIDAQLAVANAKLAAGVPRAQLYETLVGLPVAASPKAAVVTPAASASAGEAELGLAALLACHGRDLESAKTAYASLKGGRRAQVRKDCQALGVELAK